MLLVCFKLFSNTFILRIRFQILIETHKSFLIWTLTTPTSVVHLALISTYASATLKYFYVQEGYHALTLLQIL